jgi:hypothetical protein
MFIVRFAEKVRVSNSQLLALVSMLSLWPQRV